MYSTVGREEALSILGISLTLRVNSDPRSKRNLGRSLFVKQQSVWGLNWLSCGLTLPPAWQQGHGTHHGVCESVPFIAWYAPDTLETLSFILWSLCSGHSVFPLHTGSPESQAGMLRLQGRGQQSSGLTHCSRDSFSDLSPLPEPRGAAGPVWVT